MKPTTWIIALSALGFDLNSVAADAPLGLRGRKNDDSPRQQLIGSIHDNRKLLETDRTGTFLVKHINYGGNQPKTHGNGKKKPHRTMNIELDNGLIYTLENVDPTWVESKSGKGLKSGKGKISIGQGAIMSGASIDLQGGAPQVIDEDEEKIKWKSGTTYSNTGGRRHLEDDDAQQMRNLEQLHRLHYNTTFGEKAVLAVKVITADAEYEFTEEYLSERVFGAGTNGTMSIASQYSACSHNQLNLVPATRPGISNGVVTITIPTNTSEAADKYEIVNNITLAINAAFGVSNPSIIAKHVIYCLPPDAYDGSSYAYMNHWMSVYQNEKCNTLSIVMHEIGHNLGMDHSNEGDEEYGDVSGFMGYSYDGWENGPAMCFNGAKSWQTDWYKIATKAINPATAILAGNGNTCFAGSLYGIVDFESGNSNKTVIVKINDPREMEQDFYVAFNRATGMNSETREGRDQVMVTKTWEEGADDTGYWSISTLVAKLNGNESYTISNFAGTDNDLTVSVDSIDTASNPAYAQVRIELGDEKCGGTFSPTVSPTASPTISCSDGKVLRVDLITDDYPEETSWILKNTCTGEVIGEVKEGDMAEVGVYSNAYCVTDGAYEFAIDDEYHEGFCCDYGLGSYTVQYGGVVVASGGEFIDPEITTFGRCEGDPSASPTSSPTTVSPTRSLTLEPTDPPTPEPTPEPTNLPTNMPIQFCSDGKIVTVDVTTDKYPAETSWTLTNQCTNEVIIEVGVRALYKAAYTFYSNEYCVADAAYQFTIADSWGDGICCSEGQGSYFLQYDGAVVASGGEFTSSESTTFGRC
mmetsp:Transcript_1254/g.2744  ORF Transcript_1254/g.2744 Transcript_1254/m.2744 type:complete len:810 (+) Transcript_1254:238-2667(+)